MNPLTFKTLACLLSAFLLHPFLSPAQTSAFTYQGRLDDGGVPANGRYDFIVTDFDAASGGSSTTFNLVTNIGVTNGLFTLALDLTALTFPGADRWLEISVRTNGTGGFTTLSPRQRVTSAPYAIRAASAGSVAASGITGTLAPAQLPAAVVTNAATGVSLTGTFTGNGAGLTNLPAWQLGGNAGTTPGTHFLGTTDNQPLEVRVNNQRVFRFEPRSGGVPAVIGGHPGNTVAALVNGPTISGGGDLGFTNQVTAAFGTVAGGRGNQVSGFVGTVGGGQLNSAAAFGTAVGGGGNNQAVANYALVAGGRENQAGGIEAAVGGGRFNNASGEQATVAGGDENQASAIGSFVGGGRFNAAGGSTSTVGGGYLNSITTSANSGAILGGQENFLSGNYSAIVGGYSNRVSGWGAFVGGGRENSATGYVASVVGGWRVRAHGQGAFAGGGGYDGGTLAGNLASGDASVVVGGLGNTASGLRSLIGGGANNTASGTNATVVGGSGNSASDSYATVGGGEGNTASGDWATAGGGRLNTASGQYATIPGGLSNTATNYAFAAGRRAKAVHTGAFVWADSNDADFSSTASNQFNVRATGGVRVSDSTPGLFFGTTTRQMLNLWSTNFALGVQDNTTYFRSSGRFSWFFGGSHNNVENTPGPGGTVGMTLTASGLTVNGTFVSASDRNVKTDFRPVKPAQVLDKVLALPLQEWTYQADPERSRHLGPMAQDFHAAFGLGANDTTIATVDADGVAFAAIQGLNQKLADELKRRDAENAELKARLEKLEQLLNEKWNGGVK